MKLTADKIAVARQLQAGINAMQGMGKIAHEYARDGLAPFAAAFPGNVFPRAAVHEFISYEASDAAATTGFITAITGRLAAEGGLSLWVAGGRKIFPAGLKPFGIEPDSIVFINTTRPKEALWIIEEALKCEALTAVIGEVRELSFTDSRRLQLAVENSGVTGFIHRYCPKAENAVACTARWKIKALPSVSAEGLPGVGHSTWNVELFKVRNGRPHAWQVSWQGNCFTQLSDRHLVLPLNQRHTG
jgi:protein ImuA